MFIENKSSVLFDPIGVVCGCVGFAINIGPILGLLIACDFFNPEGIARS